MVFEGHVDELRKHELYERAWLLALPSLKEGWGLVVGEAGMHRTPTVAYRDAGGTRESVADGRSGLLVEDRAGFTRALAELVEDRAQRERLGAGALEMSHAFSWDHAQRSFGLVVLAATRGALRGRAGPRARTGGRTSGPPEARPTGVAGGSVVGAVLDLLVRGRR